jgi:hypothetical protein
MALTITLSGDWMSSIGSKRSTVGTITFDSSYVTGGEELLPPAVGLGVIEALQLNQGEDGLVAKWDRANQKVQLFEQDAGGALAEVGSGSNQSAVVVDFQAVGR